MAMKNLVDGRKVFILSSCIIVLSLVFLLLNVLLRDAGTDEPAETYIYIEENTQNEAEKPNTAQEPVRPEPEKEPIPVDIEQSEKPEAKTNKPAIPVNQQPAIPPAQKHAKLAIIIDDAGQSVERLEAYTKLPFPLAIAMLPGLSHTAECSALVRASGKELMLHQPMQAENLAINPGPGSVQPTMSPEQVKAVIRTNIAELGGGVKGLNNHEGSLITENVVLIGAVLDVVLEQGLYFVDSRTTVNTQAPEAAASRNMHIFSRDIFLDNVIEREEMLAQLLHGLALANKNGVAIMIGHVDKSVSVLPALLADIYPQLVKAGYVFVTPSELNRG